MRCKKLIRILPKYVDGELSEKRSALVKEHIRNCPDCAAEAKALEKMRSLLLTAGAVEAPEAYWDTYWERLEKKLPDEPLPFRMRSRMWAAIVAAFRQPAAVGRIAAYVILLALLVYMVAPDRIFKEAPESRAFARLPAESVREKAFNEELRAGLSDDEVADTLSLEGRRPVEVDTGESIRRGAPPEELIEHSVARDEISPDSELSRTELESIASGRELAPAAPAKPAIAVEEPVADSARGVRRDLADEDAAKSKDEYVAAENYFKQGQYLQAIPAYQNFITANVNDERAFRAQYQIAESYYQAGN
jgi:tetratricopeptide (TPR) repeat protein